MANATSASAYKYASLREDHFRVFEFKTLEPVITASLVDYPDNSPQEYFALSYAWGIDANTEPIMCDGRILMITPHLKEGLQQICINSGCQRLWVDAICINQASDAEKAMQVAKMHNIYRKAKGVYVWLGKEENGSDEAFIAINNVVINDDVIPTDMRKHLMERIINYRSESPQLFDVSLFKPLAALSRRPWFRRLWIAQEYFYGRSVQFFCGSKVLDGEKLQTVLMKLTIHCFGGPEPPGFLNENALFMGYHALIELDKIKKMQNEGKKLTFFDFVMLGRKRFAKEPIDRIYAAFGMAEGIDEIYRKEILIDYSKDSRANYWRVYTTFGKIALQHEPQLRLLSVVSSENRPAAWPSWCPNLNSTSRTAELDRVEIFAAGWPSMNHGRVHHNPKPIQTRCLGHPNFKGRDSNHVSILPTLSTVGIWGASFGQVTALGPVNQWHTNADSEDISAAQALARGLLEWLAKSERFCMQRCKDRENARYLWSRILVKDVAENSIEDTELEGVRSGSVEDGEHSGDSKEVEEVGKGKHAIIAKDIERENDQDIRETVGSMKQSQEKELEISAYIFMITVLMRILHLDPDVNWKEQNPELLENFLLIFVWIVAIHQDWH